MVHRQLALWLLALCLTACVPESPQAISTGQLVDGAALPGLKGDLRYGVVRSEWLSEFHARWKADLFRKGVVRWEERFDCNRFAAHYAAEAQIAYYVENFHTFEAGQAAAVGEAWFLVDGQKGRGHAVVVALTERGVVYFDPQTGHERVLSAPERASIYFVRF